MQIDSKDYVVTREVALRAGSLENKYRTADGRFILDTRALRNIRLTSEEYADGIEGVELITPQEADELIAAGGYQMGDIPPEEPEENSEAQEQQAAEEAAAGESSQEQASDDAPSDETPSEDTVSDDDPSGQEQEPSEETPGETPSEETQTDDAAAAGDTPAGNDTDDNNENKEE